jgi:hypothetical protein
MDCRAGQAPVTLKCSSGCRGNCPWTSTAAVSLELANAGRSRGRVGAVGPGLDCSWSQPIVGGSAVWVPPSKCRRRNDFAGGGS